MKHFDTAANLLIKDEVLFKSKNGPKPKISKAKIFNFFGTPQSGIFCQELESGFNSGDHPISRFRVIFSDVYPNLFDFIFNATRE